VVTARHAPSNSTQFGLSIRLEKRSFEVIENTVKVSSFASAHPFSLEKNWGRVNSSA